MSLGVERAPQRNLWHMYSNLPRRCFGFKSPVLLNRSSFVVKRWKPERRVLEVGSSPPVPLFDILAVLPRCCGLPRAALSPQKGQEPRVVAVQESVRPLHRQKGTFDGGGSVSVSGGLTATRRVFVVGGDDGLSGGDALAGSDSLLETMLGSYK